MPNPKLETRRRVSVARLLVVVAVVLPLLLHGFGYGPGRFPIRPAP